MIETVEAGREPPMFRVQFVQWEPEIAEAWLAEDPREIAKQEEEKKEEADAAAAANPYGRYLNADTVKFPYAELNGKFPKDVKPDAKECYLTDEEFAEVFKMTRAEYLAMSKPKRDRAKKEVNLY